MPTSTAIGIVNVKMPGNTLEISTALSFQFVVCRTKRSISRTSCGTKNTNVKTTKPSRAWEKTSRQMYRSMRRIEGHHSSILCARARAVIAR